MPEKEQFLDLLHGYLAGSLDSAQEQTFFHLLRQDAYRDALHEVLDVYLQKDSLSGPKIKEERLQEIEASILTAGRRKIHLSHWWSAAAALLLVAFSAYWFFQGRQDRVRADQFQASLVLPPSESKATLHMEKGKTISLDRLGQLGNGPKLIDKEHISYNNPDQVHAADTLMNVLRNPLGSRVVQVSLSDGTEVWLNAGSELRYPVRFGSELREVTLHGEAYFEVEKGAQGQGFIVHTERMDVQVLGTKFNVNAYGDEAYTKTTLLEGKVLVQTPNGDSAVIQPGQQVYQTHSGVQINDVDASAYIAWKDGYFMFARSSLSEIAKQLARWYQISVDYDSLPVLHFTGGISKEVPLNDVLEMLEKSGKVRFKFSQNQLSVPRAD